MSSGGLGKAFEQKVKECWIKSFPEGFILRLPDQMSGFHLSNNVADFICFNESKLFLLEAKSVQTASFPFANLRQYEKLLKCSHIKGVRPLVVIWYIKKDRVIAVPIVTIKKLIDDGFKSLNVDKVDRNRYYIMDIPSVKLRTFMDSDFSILMELPEDEEIDKFNSKENEN